MFNISPAVSVREFDLTTLIPQVATTVGAIAGVFRWGPVQKRVLIDSEPFLVRKFGAPTNLNPETFFTAASFLAYGNQLLVTRAANTNGVSPLVTVNTSTSNAVVLGSTANLAVGMLLIASGNSNIKLTATVNSIINSTAFTLNAGSEVTASGNDTLQFISNTGAFTAIANTGAVTNLAAQIVKKDEDFNGQDGTFDTDVFSVARYPGAPGNSLRLSLCDSGNGFTQSVNLASYANGATISLESGSNTATVVIVNSHDGSSNATAQTAAITAATNLKSVFQVTDLVEFGNSDIGTQSLKILSIGSTTSNVNSTIAASTFTVSFEDESRLIANQSISTAITRYWEFYDLVDTAPGQSDYQRSFGNTSANDELHVVIVDDGGIFTGIPGTVLETYKNVSRATDSKAVDGGTNFWKTLINAKSEYVYIVNDRYTGYSATADNLNNVSNTAIFNLDYNFGADGSDEATVAMSVLIKGYDEYASSEEVDVSLILQGKARGGTAGGQLANYIIDNICEIRKDCVAFISPDKADVINLSDQSAITDNVVEFRNSLRSTSYGFMDCGYKWGYDKYNDIYRWIPLNGDMAGLAVRTDYTNDPWWSFAGYNRGQIKNYIKLAWNPRKAYRDELYKNGINPIISDRAQTILFGDKTLLAKPSAFDRINVRRLFIVLEKSIATAAKYFLFEFNDEFTRAQFRNVIIPYLREVQGRRGIYDFLVRCDNTNNTPEIIDSNTLVGDIFIKPARSINYINLNFIAVRTGVSFSEYLNVQF